MFKQLLAALMVVGTMAAPSLTIATPAKAGLEPTALVCDNTRTTPYTGRYARVWVPAGASCYLKDAVVLGNVKALLGSGDVYIVNTRVDRNIHVKGSTGTVKIGPGRCRIDPLVGNNINVSRSHNVLICFSNVDNNIKVTRNNGRITLTSNHADNGIRVNNNLRYVRRPGDGDHRRIAAIRLRHNTAGRHIQVLRNEDRGLILRDNSPKPIT